MRETVDNLQTMHLSKFNKYFLYIDFLHLGPCVVLAGDLNVHTTASEKELFLLGFGDQSAANFPTGVRKSQVIIKGIISIPDSFYLLL